MIKNVGSKSKFKVHWKVSPYDYSKDALKNIIFQRIQLKLNLTSFL